MLSLLLLLEEVEPSKVENALKKVHTFDNIKKEPPDIRLDYQEHSIWIRRGDKNIETEVDGTMPKDLKSKIEPVLKKLKIESFITYR